ncbi:unnamed protein product [Heligmosomoides polygyrus]|uniref:Nuclear receptor n=1 Tax=Heligmosomoides polygyrus TaxID=6339 RepID=A0A3P8APU3_HELPZ|nr:unnamed protein product [Heligmosomoides polygyrus]
MASFRMRPVFLSHRPTLSTAHCYWPDDGWPDIERHLDHAALTRELTSTIRPPSHAIVDPRYFNTGVAPSLRLPLEITLVFASEHHIISIKQRSWNWLLKISRNGIHDDNKEEWRKRRTMVHPNRGGKLLAGCSVQAEEMEFSSYCLDAFSMRALLASKVSDYTTLEMAHMLNESMKKSADVEKRPSYSEPVVGKLQLPMPQMPMRSSLNCHVCEAYGAAPHYGGVVCGGCKIFFARAVQRKIYYVCEKSGSCRMVSGKRSKCRSCRYQRCLKARMCPEEVGKLRDLKIAERLIIRAKEENCVVPYFDLDGIRNPQLEDICSMQIPLIEQFGCTDGVKYMAKMFLNLERSCDNDTFATSVAEKYFCSLDVSLTDAIQNPLVVSERTPAQLTTTHMIPMILLTMSYNTFKYESVGLLLCNGFFFPTERGQFDGLRSDAELIVNELEKNVVNRFRELDVCEEEYVLLKLVLLFSHGETPDEESAETMRRLRGKYTQLLLHFVKLSQKSSTNEKSITRLYSFFELLSSLSSLSTMTELCLIHVVALDIAEMRGELTFDLHLRQH